MNGVPCRALRAGNWREHSNPPLPLDVWIFQEEGVGQELRSSLPHLDGAILREQVEKVLLRRGRWRLSHKYLGLGTHCKPGRRSEVRWVEISCGWMGDPSARRNEEIVGISPPHLGQQTYASFESNDRTV